MFSSATCSCKRIGGLLQSHSRNTRNKIPQHRRAAVVAKSITSQVTANNESRLDEENPLPKFTPLEASKQLERDFFISILSSTATKRDARSYLQQFTPKGQSVRSELHKSGQKTTITTQSDPLQETRSGVNLGSLYLPAQSIEQSPVFAQRDIPDKTIDVGLDTLHAAIVLIRDLHRVEDSLLHEIMQTLGQLNKLGLGCIIITDPLCQDSATLYDEERQDFAADTVDRIIQAVDIHDHEVVGKHFDAAVSTKRLPTSAGEKSSYHQTLQFRRTESLATLLRAGRTPIIPAVMFGDEGQTTPVQSDSVAIAIIQAFSKAKLRTVRDNQQQEVSIDRVIILDPSGGIPADDRSDGAHVFINLEQEFSNIQSQLQSAKLEHVASTETNLSESFTPHLRNLRLARDALSLLPSSSSALITTLEEAANRQRSSTPSSDLSVGTRKHKNTLIHNLLTDKPSYSPSLPTGRWKQSVPIDLAASKPVAESRSHVTTFLKRGMPLIILPDPLRQPWKQPGSSDSVTLSLDDPRVDVPRLVHLIEDSFGRKLDVEHYFSRIKDRIAGIIIAGEYEGGAILTWENSHRNGNNHLPQGGQRLIPYLDKFAVLRQCQGTGSVADIVFKAMVRTCFPDGVCWRSRQDNPVNKWYFERSTGALKIPDSNWTMFWTTKGIEVGGELFQDYESVCRQVEPSWADKKAVAD